MAIIDMIMATAGLASTFGTLVAFPGVAEKGYLDVVVEVSAPGGHSSVPPLHTVSDTQQSRPRRTDE